MSTMKMLAAMTAVVLTALTAGCAADAGGEESEGEGAAELVAEGAPAPAQKAIARPREAFNPGSHRGPGIAADDDDLDAIPPHIGPPHVLGIARDDDDMEPVPPHVGPPHGGSVQH